MNKKAIIVEVVVLSFQIDNRRVGWVGVGSKTSEMKRRGGGFVSARCCAFGVAEKRVQARYRVCESARMRDNGCKEEKN